MNIFLMVAIIWFVIILVLWRTATKNAMVQCGECGRLFENEHGLAIHKGKVHKKD